MNLGLDIDDVVADYAQMFLTVYNAITPEHITREQLTHHRHEDNPIIDREHAIRTMQRIQTTGLLRQLELIPGAQKGIQALKAQGHTIWYVTSRDDKIDVNVDTMFWLDKQDIWSPVYHTTNKAKIARALHLDVMIEDNPTYIQEARLAGITTIAYDQPWNQDTPGPRAKTWKELTERLNT